MDVEQSRRDFPIVDNRAITTNPISMCLGFVMAAPIILDPHFDARFDPSQPRISPLAVRAAGEAGIEAERLNG